MNNQTSFPMSLSFSSNGAGWAKAKLCIEEDTFDFAISYLWPGINELLDCVYYLYPNWRYDNYNLKVMEYSEADIPSNGGEKKTTIHWEQIPWKTSVMWNSEPDFVEWRLERSVNLDDDFDVSVTLDVHQEKNRQYGYIIRYKDLCYAVAKAITNFVAEYGIIGSFESSWMKDINLRHLLKIKGIAMGEAVTENVGAGDNWKITTTLDEEIQLLLKPM